MNSYSKQGILIKKNDDHAQGLPLQIFPYNFKFHIGIFARIVNNFSPVKDIKDVVDIYLFLFHPLFAMLSKSYPAVSPLCNLSNASLDFFDI